VGLVMDWLDSTAQRRALGWPRLGRWRTTAAALQLQRTANGTQLLLGLMRWLRANDEPLLLAWTLRRCDAALRADDQCWGEASYALCSLNRFAAVVRWLHDWRTRERAPAFAMANLAGSLAVLGRWQELDAVVQSTLKRQPAQEDMRLWQLLLLARAGDTAALAGALERTHEWVPDPWMGALVKASAAFSDLVKQRAANGTVAALRAHAPHGGPPQAWAMWRALRRLAVFRHTPWTRLWRWLLP
jgi:hypothetical protein